MLTVLVLGVAWGEYSGWPVLRQPIENAATRGVGVPVQMQGQVRTHLLWRPRLEVEHLRIASDARFGAPHLLDARHITLVWHWATSGAGSAGIACCCSGCRRISSTRT